MVQSWIKVSTADEIIDGKDYFLAVERGEEPHKNYMFYSQDIKGKNILSSKPGIATHIIGNDKLRAILVEHHDHVAIDIPADAERRWKRRKPVWKHSP